MRNGTWVYRYSKTELANMISKKDRRLEVAIKALRIIREEAEGLDMAETTKILAVAKAALSHVVES